MANIIFVPISSLSSCGKVRTGFLIGPASDIINKLHALAGFNLFLTGISSS
jgi:hypothetical protein